MRGSTCPGNSRDHHCAKADAPLCCGKEAGHQTPNYLPGGCTVRPLHHGGGAVSKSATKKKPNLKSAAVRQQICREVRVPDRYDTPGKPYYDKATGSMRPSKPRTINVPTHISKAVLQDLAQLAWPGNPNFKAQQSTQKLPGLKISRQKLVVRRRLVVRRDWYFGKTGVDNGSNEGSPRFR
jgi:hypothetical protein